jgi:hypothetical protein
LGAFAGGELEHEISRFAHGANQPDVILENGVAAGVALLLELLENLLGGVRMAIKLGDDPFFGATRSRVGEF